MSALKSPSRLKSIFNRRAALALPQRRQDYLASQSPHLVTGANPHSQLGEDNGDPLHGYRNFTYGSIDKRRLASMSPRCDGAPTAIKTASAFQQLDRTDRGKGQSSSLDIVHHQFVRTWLNNRDLTMLKRSDLIDITIDAHYVMTEVGEASGDTADLTCADHRNSHAGVSDCRSSDVTVVLLERTIPPATPTPSTYIQPS
jgi:hypothetical protein